MSPTILREAGYRFFFFSREEPRMHVHVQSADGEAKYWLEPELELHHNYGFNNGQLGTIMRLIEEHQDEFKAAWNRHFTG